jgi:hypothetical protein
MGFMLTEYMCLDIPRRITEQIGGCNRNDLVTCIRLMLIRIAAGATAILTQASRGFPLSLDANSGIIAYFH